jgi:hypothetical protein
MPDVLVAAPAAGAIVGPLEARHLGSRHYRNAADTSRITSTQLAHRLGQWPWVGL